MSLSQQIPSPPILLDSPPSHLPSQQTITGPPSPSQEQPHGNYPMTAEIQTVQSNEYHVTTTKDNNIDCNTSAHIANEQFNNASQENIYVSELGIPTDSEYLTVPVYNVQCVPSMYAPTIQPVVTQARGNYENFHNYDYTANLNIAPKVNSYYGDFHTSNELLPLHSTAFGRQLQPPTIQASLPEAIRSAYQTLYATEENYNFHITQIPQFVT
jgi:hypothetical protein